MRHKREDGTSIVDARIILPSQCEIDVFVENLDDLAVVNSIMLDRTGVYKITSKGLIMTNMMMEEQVIKQTAMVISANPVRLQFKSLLIQDNQPVPQVEQAADSSLLDRGIQAISDQISLSTLTDMIKQVPVVAGRIVGDELLAAAGGPFALDRSELG
jgi:hypothetical protein